MKNKLIKVLLKYNSVRNRYKIARLVNAVFVQVNNNSYGVAASLDELQAQELVNQSNLEVTVVQS